MLFLKTFGGLSVDLDGAPGSGAGQQRKTLALRARLAERLGDRSTAVHYYQFVAQAWLHADPELQPVVAEAQAALTRLGEGRRP